MQPKRNWPNGSRTWRLILPGKQPESLPMANDLSQCTLNYGTMGRDLSTSTMRRPWYRGYRPNLDNLIRTQNLFFSMQKFWKLMERSLTPL